MARKRMDNKAILLLVAAALLAVVLFWLNPLSSMSTKPPVTYGLMFDAGSTGSRVHVFSFDRSGNLLDEVFKEVMPGLSAYPNAEEAAASLKPLLVLSMETIPKHLHSCTPLGLKATAGLRRLGKEQAENHLQAVRNLLQTYPFHTKSDAVEIMGGNDEGAFAWLTINHLLGLLDDPSKKTVSVMDLGGGSTQIVFEPEKGVMNQTPRAEKYEMKLGSKKHVLYQHSYDGWGLMAAREKMFQAYIGDRDSSQPIPHPCIPTGSTHKVTFHNKEYTFTASDATSFEQCHAAAKKIFNKEAVCEVPPCSFNGVHQPALSDPSVFSADMYAISYFYDRTQLDKPEPKLAVEAFKKRAKDACVISDPKPSMAMQCTDLSYIYALLTHGYSLQDTQTLTIAKKIRGIETAWSLGAMVMLRKSVDLKCQA